METVLIIGGGITGISTAYELESVLRKENREANIIVTEALPQLGGKIRTVQEDGFIMETGADSIVARKMKDSGFLHELELDEEIVHNAVGTSYLYTDGELKQIPADAVFGIPASIESLAKTTLVSAEGKVEALKDLYTHDKKFTKEDSIGEFLEYYLGKEIVEKQIAPVLSGVYSGTLADLTIASTLPYLLEYKEKYGSIMKGIEINKAQFLGNGDKKFLSFEHGLSTIIETMKEKLKQTKILLNWKATHIEKSENRYLISFQNGEAIAADYIVLAIPHKEAEKLIDHEEIGKGFAQLKTSSLISIYLGFAVPDEVLPENGTGYITTENEDVTCNACTWTSRKWRHTSKEGNLLVRLFYKSSHPKFEELNRMQEDELMLFAMADIEKSLGIKAVPVVSAVTKWTNQMPTYQISHPKVVQTLEEYLAKDYDGMYLAGCSYYGVGIPDCIENGRTIARTIEKRLAHVVIQ